MSRMVSLMHTAEEKAQAFMPEMPSGPDVPGGLCVTLTDRELELFDLDDDVEDGDLLHLRVMIQVTGIHKEGGKTRINGAMIAGCVEDENTEGDDEEGAEE